MILRELPDERGGARGICKSNVREQKSGDVWWDRQSRGGVKAATTATSTYAHLLASVDELVGHVATHT